MFDGRPWINQHWVEVSCLLGGPESTNIGSRFRVCWDTLNQPSLGWGVVFEGRLWINSSFPASGRGVVLLGGPESTIIGSRCRVWWEALNQPSLGRGVVFVGRPRINHHWVEVSCLLGGPESTSIGSRCRVWWEALNQPALGRSVVFAGRPWTSIGSWCRVSWINGSFFTPGFYWKVGISVSENTRHWVNVVLMLGQLHGWWPNIKTTLTQCLVFYIVTTLISRWISLVNERVDQSILNQ